MGTPHNPPDMNKIVLDKIQEWSQSRAAGASIKSINLYDHVPFWIEENPVPNSGAGQDLYPYECDKVLKVDIFYEYEYTVGI